LRNARGRFATPLNRSQVVNADVALQQLFGEHVRRCDRILNRQIDADAADRRHCV
jgi:hypothetical protein